VSHRPGIPSTGEAPRPNYRLPLLRLVQAAYYIVRGQPRDLGADFRFLMRNVPVGPLVTGVDNMPASGPFVLVANHYQRPGLWMGWAAMIAGKIIHECRGRRVRWIAISEWDDYRLAGIPVPSPATRYVFGRFYEVFGFIAMPPMRASIQERAAAVRCAMEAIASGDVIGLFPEGTVGETPALLEAREGSGGFLLALSKQAAPIIPLALYEEAGRLRVAFGPPVSLEEATTTSRSERDAVARRLVMEAIAAMMPGELRGFYSGGTDPKASTRGVDQK